MAWTPAKTAGLVISLLLIITTVAGGAFFQCRRRIKKFFVKGADSEAGINSHAPTSPIPDLACPGRIDPIAGAGTVRRQTGLPQTFQDWVEASNDITPARLSFGPSSMFNSEASSTFSQPTRPNTATATATTRPGTRDSMGASSLRQAVLGPAQADKQKDTMKEECQLVAKDQKVQIPVQQGKLRGYSGAWP
ncbi:hypothetical protein EK21DRAFT_89490 [Setomelanomma holmii]|uniref:Uncharacterized protein n=1 Tax=Setomelanomma holmii TaxID=210430 RepID=A0A9P4H8N2_9PLEO|nr:hypothetical protein EK21DRAFT_89490 [Setomelanomma holmii]